MPGVHQRSTAKSARIDKEFPHQVALPDDPCCMENLTVITEFCRRFPYRVPTKSVRAAWPNGTWLIMRLHCFAGRVDAEAFARISRESTSIPRRTAARVIIAASGADGATGSARSAAGR